MQNSKLNLWSELENICLFREIPTFIFQYSICWSLYIIGFNAAEPKSRGDIREHSGLSKTIQKPLLNRIPFANLFWQRKAKELLCC